MAEPSTSSSSNNSTTTSGGGGGGDGVVRRSLNDFPDDILLHILSSLPASPSTARTSLISRKWRNLWLSTPSLNFSCKEFTGSHSPDLESLRNFAGFVDRTLILLNPDSHLLNFRIQFNFNNGRFIYQVNSWIRYAFSHHVQDLEVNLTDDSTEDVASFEFHFSLLGNSQLRVLKLCNCKLTGMLPPENKGFFSLRSISLLGVFILDQIMVDLLVACVNLEFLQLCHVTGWKDIKICSSKLRELWLQDFCCDQGSVEIVTPNMHSLRVESFLVGDYALRDASSLVEARVHLQDIRCWFKFVSLLGNIKHLYTDTICFEPFEVNLLDNGLSTLQNLKYVELQTRYKRTDLIGIMLVLYLAPNLQMMVLDNCSTSNGEASEESTSVDLFKNVNFNLQSLKHVKMKSFKGMQSETSLLCNLSKTGVLLESIVVIPEKLKRPHDVQ